MQYEKQNLQLQADKVAMYENERVQGSMGRELYWQGEQLHAGIDRNKEIRSEADGAENTISLIQISILKRKLMFGSLIVFFVIALIIVLIVKANKKH